MSTEIGQPNAALQGCSRGNPCSLGFASFVKL